MKYINIYHNRSYLQEDKPVSVASYHIIKNTVYDDPESDVIEIRKYGTHQTVKKYSKSRYFYLREDFDSIAEPDRIKPFEEIQEDKRRTREELKIENAKSLLFWNPAEKPEQDPAERLQDESPEPERKNKTSDAQLRAAKKYQQSKAEIKLRMSPELKRLAQMKAQERGMSLNEYFKFLLSLDKGI